MLQIQSYVSSLFTWYCLCCKKNLFVKLSTSTRVIWQTSNSSYKLMVCCSFDETSMDSSPLATVTEGRVSESPTGSDVEVTSLEEAKSVIATLRARQRAQAHQMLALKRTLKLQVMQNLFNEETICHWFFIFPFSHSFILFYIIESLIQMKNKPWILNFTFFFYFVQKFLFKLDHLISKLSFGVELSHCPSVWYQLQWALYFNQTNISDGKLQLAMHDWYLFIYNLVGLA